jgi:hypothetical protein
MWPSGSDSEDQRRIFSQVINNDYITQKIKILKNKKKVDNMACSDHIQEEKNLMISNTAKGNVLEEFKAGVVRSMEQYNAGLVKTFDDTDEFLDDLHNPE